MAGLWDAVGRGMVTADGFAAVRSLLDGHRHAGPGHGVASGGASPASPPARGGGRCCPRRRRSRIATRLAEAVAEQLLARWGVVFHDLLARETLAVPWREVLWALRRMEARGTARGGRFVNGFAASSTPCPRRSTCCARAPPRAHRKVSWSRLSAADPLNLVGDRRPRAADPRAAHQHGGLPRRDPRGAGGSPVRRPRGAATRRGIGDRRDQEAVWRRAARIPPGYPAESAARSSKKPG